MREGFFLEQPQQNQLEAQERPEFELDNKDIDRINTIGELDTRMRTAERVASMFASKEVIDEARTSAEEWRQHKKEVVDFATERIKRLPHTDNITKLVMADDLKIIDKYDKQTQELIDQGVGASLMTPKEKQTYYDALGRKNDFINFLRDQYGIQHDATREIYQTMALNSATVESANTNDANANFDEWDRIWEAENNSTLGNKTTEELKPPEDPPVHEAGTIESAPDNSQRIEEPASESKKDFPAKWFKTEKDSIYTYNNEGKTSRFKTVEGKQYEQQDVTMFVDLTPEETEEFLNDMNLENIGVYVVEELSNGEPHIIKDISEVQDPEKIYIASLNIDKKRWVRKKKASLKPIIGYTPFDTRTYEKNGKISSDVHLGHKIVEIETAQQEPVAESLKEEPVLEGAPAPDEAPAQNTGIEEMRVEQEVVTEPTKGERHAEDAPTLVERSIDSDEKKEWREIVINNEKISDLINAGRKLTYVFNERNEEKFNPLIEERYISPLVASFDNMHILLKDDKQTVNEEELNRAIVRITNMIKNIGNVPSGQSMRDNVESLGKVIFRLKEVEDKAHNATISLSGEKEDRPEEILQSLHKLEDTIREKWIFVARTRDALIQYQK